jgi:uncharacterized damage-inducible protein DinB
MKIVDSIIAELDREAETTRRVLQRVPDEKLTWQPHPKSMSLGQLANHIARIPGGVSTIVTRNEFEAPDFNNVPSPASAAELIPTLEGSLAEARSILSGFDDAALHANWRLVRKGKEIFSSPRIGVIRTILLNHWYHHRGQLSVYLRLLDIPLPSIYGPSADENPFV